MILTNGCFLLRETSVFIVFENSFHREDILLVKMLDDGTPCDNAYEHASVIRDRNEISLHGADYQVLDRSVDGNGRICLCLVQQFCQTEVLKILDRHRVRLTTLSLDNEPEKVALTYGRDIMTIAVKDRNRREACDMHLFERLSDRIIRIYESYILLGAGKKSYIHIVHPESVSAQILVDPYLERSRGKTVLSMKRCRSVREECIADL